MPMLDALKNRHVITALLVAPLLAVLAWFAVGWLAEDVSPEPEAAQEGVSYPLIEQPGCRYEGGQCALSNEDFSLEIDVEEEGVVTVISAQPLESILVGLRSAGNIQPGLARPTDASATRWRYELVGVPGSDDALRLVAVAAGTAYFGEASLVFTGEGDEAAR